LKNKNEKRNCRGGGVNIQDGVEFSFVFLCCFVATIGSESLLDLKRKIAEKLK